MLQSRTSSASARSSQAASSRCRRCPRSVQRCRRQARAQAVAGRQTCTNGCATPRSSSGWGRSTAAPSRAACRMALSRGHHCGISGGADGGGSSAQAALAIDRSSQSRRLSKFRGLSGATTSSHRSSCRVASIRWLATSRWAATSTRWCRLQPSRRTSSSITSSSAFSNKAPAAIEKIHQEMLNGSTCSNGNSIWLPGSSFTLKDLAVRGLYIGSKRSFDWGLHAHGQAHRRGRTCSWRMISSPNSIQVSRHWYPQ